MRLERLVDSARADPNAATSDGQLTPLFVAAHRGHAEIVSALCAHSGSDKQLMQTDRSGLTLLHHAAASGSVATVQKLLEAGVPLLRAQGLENRDRSTPLGIAARCAATSSGRQQAQCRAERQQRKAA